MTQASRLLAHLSPDKIQPLVTKYRADFSASKLHTAVFVKLFLYSWSFDRAALSLRTIAEHSTSDTFRELADLAEDFSASKSGLSDRLAAIPAELFLELFEQVAHDTLANLSPAKTKSPAVTKLLQQARILDSTIITLSAKLLKDGYQIHEGQLSLKATMAIAGRSIPVKALLYTEGTYSNENKALPTVFNLAQPGIIYIFDRGIHKRQTYADIVGSNNHFLTRCDAKNYHVIKTNQLPKKLATETLTVISDEIIRFPKTRDKTQTPFRLITAVSKRDGTTLRFLTSLFDQAALDLTELYRCRWSIEIFFRFLKSELKLEQLLSYSTNGIKVHIYLTLIAFLLTWVFKEENNIKSFKRAREKLKLLLLDALMGQVYEEGVRQGQARQAATAADTS